MLRDLDEGRRTGKRGVTIDADTVLAFRKTAFVVGPFPTLSQTFIHREFEAMAALGLPVNIVSTCPRRVELEAHSESLRSIQRDGVYLAHDQKRILARIFTPFPPARVRREIRWMKRFPHRSLKHKVVAVTGVRAAGLLAPELERRGIRYVHSHFAGFQTEVAMGLSRLLGISYGCTWHATGIYRIRNILKEKVAGARTVLTCTRHNVDHLRRLCPEHADRIHLAYHGLDLSGIPEAPPVNGHGRPVVLAVGRFVPKKGFHDLIRAAGQLRESGLEFEVRLIGEGPERSALEEDAGRLRLGDVVTFLGGMPVSEVYREMAGARVLAAPSVVSATGDRDGLPNVILESLSMARPVVASNVSAIPELVIPGETGFLAEPGKPEDLAEHLRTLIEDHDLARTLGERGREIVHARFDIMRNVPGLIAHITAAALGAAQG